MSRWKINAFVKGQIIIHFLPTSFFFFYKRYISHNIFLISSVCIIISIAFQIEFAFNRETKFQILTVELQVVHECRIGILYS